MSTFVEIMSQTSKPAPVIDNALDQQFWSYCEQGRLCFQRCNHCDRWRHLPRHMCANCGSEQWRWQESCGRGKIFSWTVTHLPMHPAFAEDVPYAVGIVELEEGVRMVARFQGIPLDDLKIDLPVELSFESAADGPLLPWFRPAR